MVTPNRPLSDLLAELYAELNVAPPASGLRDLRAVDHLASASGLGPPAILKQLHAKAAERVRPVSTRPACYRPVVPLPAGLTVEDLRGALDYTQELVAMLNAEIHDHAGVPLSGLIQANNFGGLVSNLLAVAMERRTPFARNSDREHPDVKHRETGVGIEIKTSNHAGKGGEGHNGLGGWHLIACYHRDPETGLIRFTHIEVAELVSHYEAPDGDWHYIEANRAKKATQRTETYSTTATGTWKLRHGSVYLDPDLWPGWERLKHKAKEGGEIPPWSPWYSLTRA